MDLSFHVPTSNAQFIGDEHHTSAQVRLLDMRNMKNTCAGVNLEYSLLFRYCARRFCIELMVGAPQKRL